MKINRIVQLLNKMATQQDRLARSTNLANASLERMGKTMGGVIVANINKATSALSKFDLKLLNMRQNIRLINKEASKMFSGMSMTNLFAGYYLITRMVSSLKSLTNVSDYAISTQARLGLYNTSKYSNAQLFDAMYGVSQRSRTSLSDTSDLVNRILVSGAMTEPGSATESIRIAEIINKSALAGGSTREENQRALRQLAQGLSSGALQGDELRSIREQTPFLAQILAEGLNKVAPELGGNLAIGDLKELGGKGELTAERILKAFSAMEDVVNEKFSQMPRTFDQSLTQISNVWTRFISNLSKGEGALTKINKIASEIADYLMSDRGQMALRRLENSLNSLAEGAYRAWSFIAPLVATLFESSPLLEAIIGALVTLFGLGIVSKIVSLVTNMGAFGKAGLAVAGAMLALATSSAIASQILQATGESAEEANKKVQASWGAMFSTVIGTLVVLFAYLVEVLAWVGDVLLYVINLVLSVLGMALNGILEAVYGVAWVFAKLIDAFSVDKWDLSSKVEGAMSSSANTIINDFENFTNFDKAFGSTLWENETLRGYATPFRQNMEEYWGNKIADDYMDSYDKQTEFQESLQQMRDTLDKLSGEDYKFNVGTVDKVNGTVDISSEDLKLLKDIASRDLLLNMASITPQANVTFGDVRETADVNKIMDVIEDMVENAFATSLVYGE